MEETAEELLRKILELEARHAHIKQQISKLQTSNSSMDSLFTKKLTEAQYLCIIQSMGQAMHIFDHKYRIIFWNRKAEEIYDLKAAEVYGKFPTEILVDPKDAVMADYLLERTVNGETWSGEFPVTNKRGETFVVVCTNTPFRDEKRRLIGGICVSYDSRPYRLTNYKTQHTRLIDSPHTKPSNLTNGNASEWDRSVYGVLSKMNESKKGIQKMILSKAEEWMGIKRWKGMEREDRDESLVAKLFYFGWQRLNNEEQEHKWKPEMKEAASGLWLFTVTQSTARSTTSSSSSEYTSDAAIPKRSRDSLGYEILWEDLIPKRQIGQGSCGTVYHGLWYGSDVAIKLFTHQKYSDDMMVPFKQEVSLMKRLKHPNIVLFMGAVTSPTHLCIVTEFLPRGSLFHTLQQRNSIRLDWRRRLEMAIDIAQGMNYLHQYKPPIVHRDLKSSNLLVDKNWTVKVGDFGLSRMKHQTYLKTKSGKGTPQWMAPEVIRNEQADEKSDVYSYGVVLWEIITEKIPWDDLNPMQVIAAVGFMNRRLDIPKDTDPLWASLIQSCWHMNPQTRPTFQQILYKLKDLQKKL